MCLQIRSFSYHVRDKHFMTFKDKLGTDHFISAGGGVVMGLLNSLFYTMQWIILFSLHTAWHHHPGDDGIVCLPRRANPLSSPLSDNSLQEPRLHDPHSRMDHIGVVRQNAKVPHDANNRSISYMPCSLSKFTLMRPPPPTIAA